MCSQRKKKRENLVPLNWSPTTPNSFPDADPVQGPGLERHYIYLYIGSGGCFLLVTAPAWKKMAVLGFLPVPTTYFNINQNLLIHNLTRHSPAPATPFTIKRRDFDSLFSLRQGRGRGACFPLACLPPSPHSLSTCQPKTRLFVSGLSFRTSEDSLRNAFQGFGQLVEVNLMMDKIANRPRGFAFLRYATEEESRRAIEGMHGKFLDGRVIFVEIAKSRAELRQAFKNNPRQNWLVRDGNIVLHIQLRHEMKPLGQQIYGGSVRPDVNHKQSGMTVDVVSQALEVWLLLCACLTAGTIS